MNTRDKSTIIKELRRIPGVGVSIAEDLYNQEVYSIADLNGMDPEMMYAKACAIQDTRLDPCLLYTFRCAVYYASHKRHNPELLKWWNWKDRQ
jgi:hypothetical protein